MFLYYQIYQITLRYVQCLEEKNKILYSANEQVLNSVKGIHV